MSAKKIRLCAFADEADPMIDGQIDALKANGISLLEIRGVDKKNISTITVEEAKNIRSKLDANGISVWSLGSPAGKIKINDDFGKETDTFKRMLDVGAILNAKCIRLFSFYGTETKDEYFDEVCERLDKYVELCKPYGIIPCHENEKGIYGEDAAHCLRIHKAVEGLKAVFDPANFVQANQDTLEAWNMLEEYVYYGHIKDADENGDAHTMQLLPDGYACYVTHKPEELPFGVRWIARTEDEDALGMVLPATAQHMGYLYCKKHGLEKYLGPGETLTYHITTGILSPEESLKMKDKIKSL